MLSPHHVLLVLPHSFPTRRSSVLLAKNARLASIGVYYNWQNAAWKVPYGATVGGQAMPSLAAEMAGISGPESREFRIDYAFDVDRTEENTSELQSLMRNTYAVLYLKKKKEH